MAFWSRVLAEGQRRTWTPREKEEYAIVMALSLHPATVCTDHQSLQSRHKHLGFYGVQKSQNQLKSEILLFLSNYTKN